MKKLLAATAAALLAGSAPAVTLTFENGASAPGFVFYNFGSTSKFSWAGGGYINGVTSGERTVYNNYAQQAGIAGTYFTLNSGQFTAAWNEGLSVTVDGYFANDKIYSSTFTLTTYHPTLVSFNWTGLTSLIFNSSGGVNAGWGANGTHFALDDLVVDEAVPSAGGDGDTGAVPEPATWAMMFMGFGAIGYAMRCKRGMKVSFS